MKALMRAEILAIGTELTSGAKLDTNSQWLSLELAELGIPVRAHVTVDDTLEDMVAAIRLAASRSEVLLITGGLGPTLDDLSRDAVARFLDVELVLHEPSLEHVKSMFARRKRPMPERNVVQAMFPQGSEPLANPRGTAPGIFCVWRDPQSGHACKIAVMPGVPSEMKLMYHEQVVPRLDRSDQVILRARIHSFGMGESQVEELLGDLTARGRDPEVGITAHEGTITLRIIAQGKTREECQRKIAAARQEILRCLGTAVFGEEDDELEDVVLRLLRDCGQSLATVESGTGGMLAHRITSVADYERSFSGGLIIPAGGVQSTLIGIDPQRLQAATSNSAEAAIEMAEGCRKKLGTDFALSITDWPKYEVENPHAPVPVGHVGLAGDGLQLSEIIRHFGDPAIAKSRTVKAALNLLRLHLLKALVDHSEADHGEIERRFPIGRIVQGTVVNHRPFGIFVDLGIADVLGLVEIVNFVDSGGMSPSQYPPIGNEISAIVLGYRFSDAEHRQISLGMRPSQLAKTNS